ncbi:uncharacterized protein wu:fb74b10 [Cololabis saira]|uniref:uncharacterized protein wu:fb74b10 n=1 Tax=Cololabis saira TaxID=129043 RepID=UPI002AD30181|nr:uncharacterized protein wu:fb74b10 [Cololabis saira]
MATRRAWTQGMEQRLIELWQTHECLYDVSHDLYHNKAEKEHRWAEVADALQQSVEEVKTRAVSLRTQFSRLVKPRPGDSCGKALTARQRWLLRVLDFLTNHIVHRPCKSPLGGSNVKHDDMDDPDLSDSTSDSTSSTPLPPEFPDEGTSAVTVEEIPSPVSNGSRKTQAETSSSSRGVKRRGSSENDIELQKLDFLKRMAARVEAEPVPDAFTTFGNQVASELRLLQDPALVTSLKRNIMNLIYDSQDTERQRTSPIPPTPHTFQPLISSSPPAQPPPQVRQEWRKKKKIKKEIESFVVD